MRDTARTHCVDFGKIHLWRLPNLSEPLPRVENPSKRLLMLYSIFCLSPDNTVFVEENAVISAIWSKYSWLRNTDAIENGVEIKFYVEDKVKDAAMPIFEANGVGMEDIILFDGTPFEGDPRTYYGKKCAAFTDMRFRDYDWILQIDCDIFVVAESGKKLNFFEMFFKECVAEEIGNPYFPISHNRPDPSWIASVLPSSASIPEREAEWRRRAESLIGKVDADKFWDPEVQTLSCGGDMYAFPAKHFMQNRQSEVEWFANAARLMQNDEPVIALWHAKGNPIWHIRKKLGCDFVMIGPRLSGDYYDQFREFMESETPFIFHYSTNPVDIYWRVGIGCRD